MRETIVSFGHFKICKHVMPLCQQDMPLVNEMMAPLLFAESDTIFAGFKGNNSVTVKYVLFAKLQRAREMDKPRNLCGGGK